MTRVDHIPLVDLTAQYRSLADAILPAIQEVLESGDFILGRALDSFEQEFAAYLRTTHAIGVGSGLDALRLSLMAFTIGPGDEVIVPANTYIATALAVSSVGATPVIVDCLPDTGVMDIAKVEAAVTGRTKAIIPVHLYGYPLDLTGLLGLARSRSLAVIEDAAQAHGAGRNGRSCGTIGDLGCFSFYPSKNLGACGDGGMVVTADGGLAERIRALRNYGQRAKNLHTVKGMNSRLDSVQAAILRVKLRHLDRWNQQRRAHADRYRELLPEEVSVPPVLPDATPVYHLFVIQTAQREALRTYLEEHGIHTGVHYPFPIHLQPPYADLGLGCGTFPVAERMCREVLSLPMYPELAEVQIERIAESVRSFFRRQ